MKKQLALLSVLALSSSLFAACSAGNNLNATEKEKVLLQKAPAESQKEFIADVGGKINGKLTGKSLSVKINMPAGGFETKATTNGQQQGLVSNIQSYTVYLTSSSVTPVSGTMAGGSSFVINRNSGSLSSGSHTITFTNVPVGTWFAAAKAWDGSNGTGNNITAPFNFSTDGVLKLAVSTNSLTVNTDLTISPTNGVLNINMQLQNAVGNSIDTQITPTDGSPSSAYGAI